MKKHFLFFLKIIGLFLVYIHIGWGKSYEGICGDTTFVVKKSGSKEELPKVYYKVSEKEEHFLYEASAEKLEAACVKDFHDKEYLLLEEICGGSGCSDFGEYRIIDPISKKILLGKQSFTVDDDIDVPDDDANMAHHIRVSNHEKRNIAAAKKILGYEPPLLTLFINKFC